MSSKTKIFVFHMKELIYTGIFLLLGIVLILLLVSMFAPKPNTNETKPETKQETQISASPAFSSYD